MYLMMSRNGGCDDYKGVRNGRNETVMNVVMMMFAFFTFFEFFHLWVSRDCYWLFETYPKVSFFFPSSKREALYMWCCGRWMDVQTTIIQICPWDSFHSHSTFDTPIHKGPIRDFNNPSRPDLYWSGILSLSHSLNHIRISPWVF